MKTWMQFFSTMLGLLIRLALPGGAKRVASENIALRQQLIVLARHQKRAPNLTPTDRFIFGFMTAFINPKRLLKVSIILKPSTLLKFHKALVQHKYHLLFSNKIPRKPGPKGPEQKIIDLIVEMKTRNPRFGYRRIAMQISNAFGIEIDKDIVRRVLAKHDKPSPGDGPSWLTFIGHAKDNLWSVDLFRCESKLLKSHWVMVVMDQFTRRIIGFSVHAGSLDGVAVCCLFNTIVSRQSLSKYLSSDNDPLFRFHRWLANLRILDVEEIKSVPHTPTSHPFIERLIGTVRQELLDQTLFWNKRDLQNKLNEFMIYYNRHRCHMGIERKTPLEHSDEKQKEIISVSDYRWDTHCRGLIQLPMAA